MTSDPLIGKHLGAYQILEPIGQGGMATVYKAMQTAMNRIVAVKVLSPQMAANSIFAARFKQEAQMIASLEHAHVLPVYDVGEQDGVLFIAMRYMGFGSVQSHMAGGKIALRDVAHWIEQTASALDYAHERGVIHRDVKPSNVLIDAQGNAFLADFGIAKWMEGSIQLTGSNVIGTPQYMSPEQGQGLKIDGRSDEYSLAVMAYEMLAGRPPFEAETPLAVVLKHVTEPLTPPTTINPRVPAAVSEVIVKALNKAPADRYPTAGAFAEALSNAIRTAPVPGTAPLPATAVPTEEVHVTAVPTRPPKSRRLLWTALAALMIVLAGIGGVVWLSANQPPPERPAVAVTLGPNILIQTRTPAATPAPTLAITTAVSNTTDTCKLIFAESFDQPSTGLPVGEQEGAAWGYIDGEYRLLIKSANFFQSRLIGPALKDYELNVDARFASETTGDFGVMIAARGPDDYVAFVVDANRQYAITRRTPGGSKVIQDWTFAPALNAGQAANHLRAVQRGRDIALYANGVVLKLITDDGDPKTDRQIGLTAASFGKGGVDARFDNLKVCEAPSAFSTKRVTLIDAFDDNRNGWAPQKYSAAGTSSIENGKFEITALYEGEAYGWSDWNPNVAFDNFDLDTDLQMTDGVSNSQIGMLFGVQDLNNAYLFSLINDGRFALYSIVDGSYQTIADPQASDAIRRDRALNHVHLSVLTGTLKIDVNGRPVLQAAVAYTPGFVGFWCGVYASPQTRCTFDNLSVVGTPSTGPLTIYPFCNCRREVRAGQPLTAAWSWGAKTPDLLQNLQARTIMTATLDGQSIDRPQQYWGKTQTANDGAQARWLFKLPPLDPGSHILALTVHSEVELTDGFDGNGDGKPDTYGPGDFLSGYVEVVVQP